MENPTLEEVEKELAQVEADVAVLKNEGANSAAPAAPPPVTEAAAATATTADTVQPRAAANAEQIDPVATAPGNPTQNAQASTPDPSVSSQSDSATSGQNSPAADAQPGPAAAPEASLVNGAATETAPEAPVIAAQTAPEPAPADVAVAAGPSIGPDTVEHSPVVEQPAATAPDTVTGPAAAAELPLYQCHKKVRAAKIIAMRNDALNLGDCLTLSNGTKVEVSEEWLTRNPATEVGGYFVEYQEGDGYTSYSPAGPFESGYTKI